MKDEAVLQAVRDLRKKGVTALKFELEAQLDRRDGHICGYCEDGQTTCDYCLATGTRECSECGGECQLTDPENSELMIDCEACGGEGQIDCDECEDGYRTCNECNGDYDTTSEWDNERDCLNHILDTLASLTNTSRLDNGSSRCEDGHEAFHPLDWIAYARFYNDHSVDSELTITVPITSEANVLRVPKILEAFSSLGDEVGNGLDVRGAGMHTAALFTDDYSYPSGDDTVQHELLENFQRSMTQLLPALYFLGSSNEKSRPIGYRMPRVVIEDSDSDSWDDDPKYSAVVYREGAIEFRVFDTCYDKPETVLDNIVVIANCMKYLSRTYKNPGLNKIASRINFGRDDNNDLERFYRTERHLDVLNAGLQKIKPSYYSVKQLKDQRNFKRSKRSLKSEEKEQTNLALKAFEEYRERFEWTLVYREQDYKALYMQRFIENATREELRAMTPDEIEHRVEADVKERLEREKNSSETQDSYISQKITEWKSARDGRTRLLFN